MFRDLTTLLAALALSSLSCLVIGCASDPPGSDSGGATAGGPPAEGPAISSKANVRFKRGERLRNDVAQALGLLPEEVCNELGKFSCADLVHTVPLGGADPYVTGIFEPASDTAATSPLAVDRLVLSACIERGKRDFADLSKATVFQGLPVDAAGKLPDPKAAAVSEVIDRLYKRALARRAAPGEIEKIAGFYSAVEAKAKEAPAKQWATLSCYAVLTTTEFLFY